jgi:hypothetical protein
MSATCEAMLPPEQARVQVQVQVKARMQVLEQLSPGQ